MSWFARLAALVLLALAPVVHAAEAAAVASPDGKIRVSIDVDGEGHVRYSVARGTAALITPSWLGFLFTDAPKLHRNLSVTGSETRSFDETWTQPWGERTRVRNHFNELRVHIKETKPLARGFDVVFRVFDDGFGFRYEFADQPNLHTLSIAEELTQFNLAQDGTAWWVPAFEWNREEYIYNTTPIREIATAQTPLTVKLADGTHIAFHEAALVDYAGMNIARVQGTALKAVLTPSSRGPKVVRAAPFTTPWRTLQISPDAAGLAMSNLILNLNEPNKLGDVSWVHPRKYVGIWWGMHLDSQSWASGTKHGATTANAFKTIDFAAANGLTGVLIEGWNLGWDGDWFADGKDFSFTQAYPDFDLPKIAAYAKSKGVHLIGHHETSANIAHYEAQMDAAFDLYAKLGIDAVKTGYVSDAGGMQARGADGKTAFEWHEGQASSVHHLKVVTEAAKRHIAINAHEPIKDTGLRRTYPNWVSREGARGMEYNAWGAPPNPPEHESVLVFTRMLGGPMDFTPGVLSLTGKHAQQIQSTEAKQLALYVVLYSPIQMAADLPENYAKYPRSFQFIKDVPTDWSDTRVLNGEVGDYVTIARKDRASDNWYLGAVGDEQARTSTVKLNFLDPGRSYTAQIYRDGDGADWKANPHAVAYETRKVTSADSLTLALAPGGGQAIRFVAGPRK